MRMALVLPNGRPYWHWKGHAWYSMNRRCSERTSYSKIKVKVKKKDLFDFLNANFSLVSNMISAGQKPSIDRIDSKGHYELSNIQIVDCIENTQKPNIARRTPVVRIDLKNGKTKTYESLRAVEDDGFSPGCVQLVTSGKRKLHKGFSWSLADYARGNTDDSNERRTT